MKKLWTLILSVIIGIIITYITGFFDFQNRAGGNNWGFPLVWITQPVIPNPPPKKLDYIAFLFDVIIWFVIIFLIFFLYYKVKKG